MDLNRNQFFIFGLVMLLFGIQFRMVESYVLSEKASRFLAERMQAGAVDGDGTARPFVAAVGPTARRSIKPPDWLGWCLVSTGAVLILHSLAMKKPGG